MQILQWLLKTAIPESPKTASDSPSKAKPRDEGEKATTTGKSKNIVVVIDGGGGGRRRRHLKGVEKSTKLSCDDMILLRFMQRKDVSKPFFYHSLNLKGLGSFFERGRSSEKATRRKRSEGVAAVGGDEVYLPGDDQCSSRKGDDRLNDSEMKKCRKRAVFSRVKELMRWNANAKVMNTKKKSAPETTRDDDQVTDESPKISIRWEMEISSTISSILRASPVLKENPSATVIGSWITTDSEFVVLEL